MTFSLRRHERWIARCVLAVCAAAAVWHAGLWLRITERDALIREGGDLARLATIKGDEARYALGYWHAKRGEWRVAVRHFVELEGTSVADDKVLAKFALGNVYFDRAHRMGSAVAGAARLNALAQFDLAREAYREALRLDPDFHPARHNLELLEHSAPARRIRGWARDTDGVTLQPFKRNGWTGMREKPKRGLP